MVHAKYLVNNAKDRGYKMNFIPINGITKNNSEDMIN